MLIREILDKILLVTEDIEDFYFISFKEEMLSVLFLYCMGLSDEEIMLKLLYLKLNAIKDFLKFMENRLGSYWVEIENLHKSYIGFKAFVDDAIISHCKEEVSIPKGKDIKNKYFGFLNENCL